MAKQINDEIFLAVQIESRSSVEHCKDIMAVDGVDGYWIGPGDLAKSMGVDLDTPDGKKAHESAILRVLMACRENNKIPGIWAGSGNALRRINQGFLFVVAGGDYEFVLSGAREVLQKIDRQV